MDASPTITVASLEEAERLLTAPEGDTIRYVVSFGDPGSRSPLALDRRQRRGLRLEFHDIDGSDVPSRFDAPPDRRHAVELIEFLREVREVGAASEELLIHCRAGISRSTAAALIYFYLCTNDAEESRRRLSAVRRSAFPNRLLIEHADAILGSRLALTAQAIHDARAAELREEVRRFLDKSE